MHPPDGTLRVLPVYNNSRHNVSVQALWDYNYSSTTNYVPKTAMWDSERELISLELA